MIGTLELAWVLTVLYGADEWLQMYGNGRHAEWKDRGADALDAREAGFVVKAWKVASGRLQSVGQEFPCPGA
jgi:hypothetical protein